MPLILTLFLLYISKVLPSLSGITLYSAPGVRIENCAPSICKDVLDKYLTNLNPEVQLVRDSETLIVGFLHPKPQDKAALSLGVKIYLLDLKLADKDDYKEKYPNHCNTKDDGMELTIEFPNLDGCNHIVVYGGFTYYQCIIKLEYESEWSHGIVKQLQYKITVGVPANRYAQYRETGGPLYNDCDCTIIPDIKHRSKIYVGISCDNEITPETSLNDDEYLCWEIIMEDPSKLGADLEVISIKETSVETIEVIDAVSLKCKAGTFACLGGKAYVIFRPSFLDWSELSMTVKFNSKKSIKSEAMNVKYLRRFPGGSEPSNYTGAIVGSVVGSIVGTFILGYLLYYCCCKAPRTVVVVEKTYCCSIF